MKKSTALVVFSSAVAAAAGAGSFFNPGKGKTKAWYATIKKPPFTPPNIVFPIVWTTLYTAMAASAYRVSQKSRGEARSHALSLWSAQLALNALWNPTFFGAKKPALALADLVALMAALAAYTQAASRIDRTAAALMLPYLAWVGFAGAINFEIVRLNNRR